MRVTLVCVLHIDVQVGSVMNPTPDKAQVLSIGVLARVVQVRRPAPARALTCCCACRRGCFQV